MSKAMRVFCLLSAIALIAGSIWLYTVDQKNGSFLAACFVYPMGCIVLVGEAFGPLVKELPKRPYMGESRATLAQRGLEDLRKLTPNSKWLANYSAVKAGLLLGFVVWVIVLALLYAK
ncbi:hypothetical protein [Roseateles sp. BYS96W]|uniref:DUF3899 domain-containing protein n=1 Tax=Pelomonas nitida TaxID=3299027 RepID=A0ABW7GAQ6_9BURK